MRIEFDTRALKIDPRAFYWWATLALMSESIFAGGMHLWWVLAVSAGAYAAAFFRMRWWVRRENSREHDEYVKQGSSGWPPMEIPIPPPPDPRRVYGLCMFCQKDVFFDPMAPNAGICEACAGGPG